MRGFQPTGHPTSKAQNYADGGLVQGFKRMVGLDHNYNIEQAAKKVREREARAAAQQPAAPATAPATNAISDYAAGGATARRMQEIDKYADGGPVRGKGTGTSDEVPDKVPEGTYIMPADSTAAVGEKTLASMGRPKVPVKLSNGEFKLPPEQVHAIGVQALDQMKNATHTPVGFAPGAQQAAEPRMFFANGGVVDEERRGAGTPGAAMAATTTPPPAAAAGSTAAATPTSAGFMPGTQAVFKESGRAISDLAKQGRYGAAAGETARSALAYVPAVVDDVVGGAVRTVGPSVMDAGRQLFGMNDAAPAAPAAPAGPAQAPKAPAAAPAPTAAPAAPATPAAVTASPATDTTAAAASTPDAQQVVGLPGVFRSGNSYSSTPEAAAAGAQPSAITAQDMAAAEGLDARSRAETQSLLNREARGFQVAGPESGALATPGIGVIGEGYERDVWRKQLTDQLTSRVIPRGLTRSQANLMIAQRNNIAGVLDGDTRQQMGQTQSATALQQTGLQQSGETGRAALRDQGETGRTILRETGDTTRATARNAIDMRRADVDAIVRGFDIRAAQRAEQLQQRYAAAKTPAERQAIAQEIRDLNGKTDPANRFTVVPGGQEWDAQAGVMRNVPGRVLNNQTGQFVDGAAGGRPLPPMAQNPAALAIKNDTSLTRAQKEAKLRELGYN